MTEQLSEVFMAIADFALARNAHGIKDLPGCYEVAVDDHWWIAVNGHDVPTRTSKGTEVPKFSAYVEFNGWPAGMLDPFGGVLAAGEIANEDALLAALRSPSQEQSPQ